jgi:hypothetical protein
MKIGDRIHLTKDVDSCSAGDEGIVRAVDAQGRMTVEITHRADCSPFTDLLLGVLPAEVALGAHCAGAGVSAAGIAMKTMAKPAGAPKAGRSTGRATKAPTSTRGSKTSRAKGRKTRGPARPRGGK